MSDGLPYDEAKHGGESDMIQGSTTQVQVEMNCIRIIPRGLRNRVAHTDSRNRCRSLQPITSDGKIQTNLHNVPAKYDAAMSVQSIIDVVTQCQDRLDQTSLK